MPSERATRNLHLAVLGILLFEMVYWLAQPCTGDFMCAPIIGYYLSFVLVPLAVGVFIWRIGGRASLIVALDVFLVAWTIPTMSLRLVLGGTGEAIGSLLAFAPLLLLVGTHGALADLAPHRNERWLTISVLLAEAAWFGLNNAAPLAVVPLAAAAILALGLVSREPEAAT